MPAVKQKRVQLSHGTTNYVEAGTGYPVIMLHGSMIYQGGVDWLPSMGPIAESFRVIAPDFLGWPAGDTRANMDAFPSLVDFVREFQDALNIESSHIVGTSMGGWIAGLLAYESPDRVGKCVQTGHNGFNASPNAGMTNYDKPPSDQEARDWVLNVTKGVDVDGEALLKQKLHKIHDPAFLSAFQNLMHSMGEGENRERYSLQRRFAHLKVPTLFLFGENDHGPMKIAAELPKALPGSRLVVMKDSGHRNHIEQPAVFGKNVVDFLSD
ncbi:MAG TPA: alpha/beta hydrolase [Dehalococcoidia bacterium]|nr:alpha/beta hydrolase [Dehalococcoidia bacterium]